MTSQPQVEVSVVTPSFNMLEYLKRCCRSVADQKGLAWEHIVIDGGSSDGTPDWLRRHHAGPFISEPDQGMYDAINKGLRLARGEILAYLNCDEQYLPGTLKFVRDFFSEHPDADILFGDHLLVRPDGSLIAYRKGLPPYWWLILGTDLYVFSCAMFFRRRLIDEGQYFDPRFRDIGDEEFVVRCLRAGYRACYRRRYLSAFTMTGKNLSCGDNPHREKAFLLHSLGLQWIKPFRAGLFLVRVLLKLVHRCYWETLPLQYAVYTEGDCTTRTEFTCTRASWKWRKE